MPQMHSSKSLFSLPFTPFEKQAPFPLLWSDLRNLAVATGRKSLYRYQEITHLPLAVFGRNP
jgi:hypothetical protein